jgi:hypothetical protein
MYRSDEANTVTDTVKVCITQLHSQYLSTFHTCNADTDVGSINHPNVINTVTNCQARSLLTQSLPY